VTLGIGRHETLPAAPRRRTHWRMPIRRLALAALLAVAGCATVREVFQPAPVGRPAAREGWLVYELRELRFEAPAAWRPSGGERRLALEAPDGKARLEISYPEQDFADERSCLAAADEKLRQQAGAFERGRRHATRFAGLPAQTLEGDRGGWHVWAFAACDRGAQYRVFFTAASPASADALEAYRSLLATARAGGEA
jgi:hypothetical protein